jgi:hypothetical protein
VIRVPSCDHPYHHYSQTMTKFANTAMQQPDKYKVIAMNMKPLLSSTKCAAGLCPASNLRQGSAIRNCLLALAACCTWHQLGSLFIILQWHSSLLISRHISDYWSRTAKAAPTATTAGDDDGITVGNALMAMYSAKSVGVSIWCANDSHTHQHL